VPGGYGPLKRVAARNTGETLLALPQGFAYNVLGKTGQRMSDGVLTPGDHDGMAAFVAENGLVRLVRNHEVGGGDVPRTALAAGADRRRTYDPTAPGGTTTLLVDPRTREIVRDWVSLSGTLKNCAGGPTPWGSWISCEETVLGATRRTDDKNKPVGGFAREHGYCFEVPARADGPVPAVPLKAMGRFVHEAIAVDPATGIVYQTEDRQSAGFYRFLPNKPGRLNEGGKLQMLRVTGKTGYDTRAGQTAGKPLACDWVNIRDPDPAAAGTNDRAVLEQGLAEGGALFARLEGCWYGNGRIFLNATSGGDKKLGQVWQFVPIGESAGELTLLFESRDPRVLDSPDNLCVSPRGGLILCEDAEQTCFVRGLTRSGRIFDLAQNVSDSSEFAGATFSPDGRTLFVNVQAPVAFTCAIWGPWERGVL
jgi:secreted PhoX family phosphatase